MGFKGSSRTSELDIGRFPPANREVILFSTALLKDTFTRNAAMCKTIGISVKQQLKEINETYGLYMRYNTISNLKTGKRFKCGLLLLVTLKHYWRAKGYHFRIDEL